MLLLPEEVLQMTAAIETLRCMALETGDLFLTFYLTMLYQAFFVVWTCRYWPSSAYRFCFFLAELVGFLFPVNWKFLITLPLQAGRDILVFEIALHYSLVELLLFILYYPDPFSAKVFTLGGEERGVQFSEFAFIIAMCSSLESLNSPMMA